MVSRRVPPALRHVRVPHAVMQETIMFLRAQGKLRKEGIVLWRGVVDSHTHATVRAVIAPPQTALSSEYTGHVSVPLEARAKITRELNALGEVLLVQVHSHPAEAFHSQTDDEHPVILHKGAISVVVPYFGDVSFDDFANVEVFRLLEWPNWRQLSSRERAALFLIEGGP